ncbi:hypothetical protein AK812_SmicGene41003 [Symbiodinium microadriaticum]|uniref:Uncharacterized protein n=1 Tax=Symbiodinium microadriaticum TaxID=2951 RepID=A0A1Q9C787_SYMMI|nr:hypothetical protein AK812_SmicGene41003 [Symbiodinium microadriaticum]
MASEFPVFPAKNRKLKFFGLHRGDCTVKEEETGSGLRMWSLEQFAWGHLSRMQIQKIAELAVSDARTWRIKDLDEIGQAGTAGRWANNLNIADGRADDPGTGTGSGREVNERIETFRKEMESLKKFQELPKNKYPGDVTWDKVNGFLKQQAQVVKAINEEWKRVLGTQPEVCYGEYLAVMVQAAEIVYKVHQNWGYNVAGLPMKRTSLVDVVFCILDHTGVKALEAGAGTDAENNIVQRRSFDVKRMSLHDVFLYVPHGATARTTRHPTWCSSEATRGSQRNLTSLLDNRSRQ